MEEQEDRPVAQEISDHSSVHVRKNRLRTVPTLRRQETLNYKLPERELVIEELEEDKISWNQLKEQRERANVGSRRVCSAIP